MMRVRGVGVRLGVLACLSVKISGKKAPRLL